MEKNNSNSVSLYVYHKQTALATCKHPKRMKIRRATGRNNRDLGSNILYINLTREEQLGQQIGSHSMDNGSKTRTTQLRERRYQEIHESKEE